VGEEVPKRCDTCACVPLVLFTFSHGRVVHVRFGCLCSSVILYSESEPSPVIPAFARTQLTKHG
jgi:hypothetical protein